MAEMLVVGVVCARRRRFHKSGECLDSPFLAPHNSTRFCLYASNHESCLSSLQRSMLYHAQTDESMVGAAREAKQRLDDKFRAQRISENKRQSSIKCVEERRASIADGSKKRGFRRFSWSKLSWKATEQEDCAVCLGPLRNGETLTLLFTSLGTRFL